MLCGVGGYVPTSVVTNTDLTMRFSTSEEWISSRTGIRQRHVVTGGDCTSDLAVQAGAAALKSAGVDSVDLIVLATVTPDHPCPATAPSVARRLGLGQVAAFDLGAACSGFVYGLAVVAGFLGAGLGDRVLLIGADAFSTKLNPADRGAVTVFGDGAGAAVLRRGNAADLGALLAFDLGSDGKLADLLMIQAGGSKHPPVAGQVTTEDHLFSMTQGKAVYRHATCRMTASAQAVLRRAGWRPDEVDWFVGHQANQRILEAVGKQMGIAPERVFINIDQLGNTVAASIPLALADATAMGVLKAGHKVVLTTFGAGSTWGSVALTWPEL
ncbi:MAG TPA: beta-ketoacyl-ACP synthase III [Streptosporangiaceae bacterium]